MDKLVDTINAARLKMVERFLHNKNMSHDIMQGAIHRLRMYAKTDDNPMETNICDYVDPQTTKWLYHLKKWMEEKGITMINRSYLSRIKRDGKGTPTGNRQQDIAIINTVQQKTNKKQKHDATVGWWFKLF